MPARPHGPTGPRAPSCPHGSSALSALVVSLSVSLAFVVAGIPRPALAAFAAPEVPKEVEDHYDRGIREREAGRHAVAVEEFTAAYEGMPRELKDMRASVLWELIDAHRSAYSAGGEIRGKQHPAAHLCAAEELLDQFLAEQEAERKPRAKKSPDALRAVELRGNIDKDLRSARAASPDLDCATVLFPREVVEPEPEPTQPAAVPPPRREINKPLVIAGSVTAGVGLLMIGLMAGGMVRGKRAEEAGQDVVDMNQTLPPDDPDLVAIDKRGKSGNNMAIAGGVLSLVCLGVGATLLVFGLRRKPSKVAAAPYATPHTAGLTLRWQF